MLHVLLLGVLRLVGLRSKGLSDLDIAVLIHLGLSLVDHVAEDVGGLLAVLCLLLEGLILLEQLIESFNLFIDGLLPQCLLSFFVCNLPLGSSPLGAGFEHIHSIALGS